VGVVKSRRGSNPVAAFFYMPKWQAGGETCQIGSLTFLNLVTHYKKRYWTNALLDDTIERKCLVVLGLGLIL